MSEPKKTDVRTTTRILLVDDDPIVRESLSSFLASEGHEVAAAASVAEAIQHLHAAAFGLIITDVAMPDHDGFELLRYVSDNCPETVVIMVTGYGTIASAIEAIKEGAYDYLTKPIIDDDVRMAVERALQQQQLLAENRRLRCELSDRSRFPDIIGQDYRMSKVFELMEAVADSSATVLITGESGTGKSLIARAIHERSVQREKPFVEVACGALPDTLLESELFGHLRGAFTGAVSDKQGKFAAADGGTIFLDEISTASPQLQVKLLRVLQERAFEPLGSNETRQVDVRVILATNHDLWTEVEAGRFRRDLYYRINVVNIELPPLRDRIGDIPLLAEHFLSRYLSKTRKQILGFTPQTMQRLQQYAWPGNARELENSVERAVVLCRGATIDTDDLPPAVLNGSETFGAILGPNEAPKTLREALAGPERQILLQTLQRNAGNRQATADQLGINRTTLYKKMKRYGLLEL